MPVDREDPLRIVRKLGPHVMHAEELTIRLDRLEAAGKARVSWYRSGEPLDLQPRTVDAFRLDDPTTDDLFRILFPPLVPGPPDAEAVMRLLGRSRSPLGHMLRLRICVDHPPWAALPWQSMTFDGMRLVDDPLPWTVEVVDTLRPKLTVALPRVPDVLVVEGEHLTASGVQSALKLDAKVYARPNHVIGVGSINALPARLSAHRRPIVLAGCPGPNMLATLCGPHMKPATERHAPAALCLIGAGETPLALLERFPFIVRVPDVDEAKRWLRRVVLDGADPTVAAHGGDAPSDDARKSFPVCSAYARWTPGRVNRKRPPPPGLVLDRIAQRDRVLNRLKLLLDPDTSAKLAVFVASGPPKNRIDLLAEQLEEHIADERPELHFEIWRPRLPREGTYREGSAPLFLEHALGEVMQLGDRRDPAGLARHLARGHLRGTKRIVWLDWGAFGHDAEHPPLKRGELRSWLDWHIRLADHARRENVCIAAFIGCQAKDPRPIQRVLDDAVRTTDLTCIEFSKLAPLEAVKVDELRMYLNTYRFSGVEPDQLGPLTRALDDAVPGGGFEQLVGLLELGLSIGWQDLLERLKGPCPVRDDDDEAFT